MSISDDAVRLHEEWRGKIEVTSKVPLQTKYDLSTAYTPGVAEPCRMIHKNKDDVYKFTSKGNMVAVVTDGTAVLGLGDIGPEAALPVMEGKAVLFKTFGGVDAFPICIPSKDADVIVQTVKMIEPVFGGINLEDISSPRCVEIERRLKKELNIPVFHDDQHGTAVVVAAGLINSLKIVGKRFEEIKIAVSGAGAAGNAIVKMLKDLGVKDIIVCSSKGILSKDQKYGNWVHQELAEMTNQANIKGGLADAMKGADVFIGVSAKGLVTKEMAASMNKDAIIFAMANPDPEIMPDAAKEAGARIVGTGRSDFSNQINNVLAFPGIFRGALDARASDINEEMKKAAAYAIASLVTEEELNEDYIIVPAFDPRVGNQVAKAVYSAAVQSGVARGVSV
ncbi:NAD(P)-dependent malic enzyme [Sinanaerobacter chloroacetimidivorans]|uniref:NAD-dependent malic enzyme n=1 Tax=Sinanaerobacter chloroacetimidivorans TaxID=2818044 RepID=A0A8J7W3L9_9FIRM|nr:malic enzyme-like NAD(P)-binding protein [Sinanaerobacter chloroacetimidivorans]MBR0600269.1 NAD-dependent malic enzyme [Sinanaerobacter chloroacetimidivorans]